MDNRISLITSLKDCISTRNSIILPVTSTNAVEPPSQQDVQYGLIRKQVRESNFFANSNRHIKIRLQKWLQFLDRIRNNKMWIKSRNKYIKLLNLMCYCECLLEPFISMPPEGELPTLRKHEVNTIIDEVERQIKSSANGSRRMSQNNETVKEVVQNQMENIFATFTQQQRRFQTYSSNSYFQDDSTLPLRLLHNNDEPKRFETEADEKTVPMRKISLEPQTIKMTVSCSYEKSDIGQLTSIPEEFNNMKPKIKVHVKHKSKLDAINFETRCSGRSSSKEKKEEGSEKDVIVLREISLKDFNRPPVCPSKFKYDPVQSVEVEEGTFKQETVQRQYWEENSAESAYNSGVVTPKYLNNLSSQQGDIQECVEIVSFREKEGDNCDCTSQILGQGWISNLLKKITF